MLVIALKESTMNSSLPRRDGEHFTAITLGPQAALPNYHFTLPDGRDVPGKLFLREWLGASGVEISWGSLPPRTACRSACPPRI